MLVCVENSGVTMEGSWGRWELGLDLRGLISRLRCAYHRGCAGRDGGGYRNKMIQDLLRFTFYLKKQDYGYLIYRVIVV